MKTLTTISILLISHFCMAQGYLSLAVGHVAIKEDKIGRMTANVAAGYVLFPVFAELNMIKAITWSDESNQDFFQVRSGVELPISDMVFVRPFFGYSVTPLATDEVKRVGTGGCAGLYLIQFTKWDFQIKYEVSVNNGWKIVPAIGIYSEF